MAVTVTPDSSRDRVAHLRIDFGKLNLLTLDEIHELRDAIDSIPDDVSVVTLGPEGGKESGLTAGLQLEEVRDFSTSDAREMLQTLHGTIADFRDLHAVTICCCGEYALGGGLELAMACDFRVALEDAALGLPEIDAGLVTGIQGGLLVRLVGLQAAKEIIYTGEPISGLEATDLGLVNYAVPIAEYDETVDELIDTISAKSPLVLRRQREVFRSLRCNGIESGIEHSLETIATCFDTHDQHEAMTAFLEDREPQFEGR